MNHAAIVFTYTIQLICKSCMFHKWVAVYPLAELFLILNSSSTTTEEDTDRAKSIRSSDNTNARTNKLMHAMRTQRHAEYASHDIIVNG